MRYCFFMMAVMLFSCKSNQRNSEQLGKEDQNRCFIYPSEVDSLRLQDLYDSARWYIYTRYCDIEYKSKSDSLRNITFGELELRFDNVWIKSDTIALNFNFIDKGQPILSSMMRDYKQLATGVGFDAKTRKRIYIISSNVNISYQGDPQSRYENPLQPEVIKYINKNLNKLNRCFKELALQKGLK